MLQDLIPELAEAVFSYCTTVELKNLSRCCHSLKNLCRPTLWHTVQIPAAQLLDETFASDPKLQYLLYTKVLRIFGMFSRKVSGQCVMGTRICVLWKRQFWLGDSLRNVLALLKILGIIVD